MCGIAGILDPTRSTPREVLSSTALDMARAVSHRGPDGEGVWVDEDAGVALGHRRLAVIDVSERGAQPMVSADGSWVLVFNGEVYNHVALRHELEAEGARFRGHCDTEVMLEAFARWGVERAVERFIGMFAFALWDARRRQLVLGRDRVGKKPLYYGRAGKSFVFGSELRALKRHPAFDPALDPAGAALLLRFSYIPAPSSIYREAKKLRAGTLLYVDADAPERAREQPYWSAVEVACRGLRSPLGGNLRNAADRLEAALEEAVRLRMLADVPVGAFLSGGVDSSLIVSMMQEASNQPVRTFSIGFEEADVDESAYAREVAGRLGTEHTEIVLTGERALSLLERLPGLLDEPFADPSQIPTLAVAELTRSHVTVALSGDGGDELFGGYRRYRGSQWAWQAVGRLPESARRAAALAARVAAKIRAGVEVPDLPGPVGSVIDAGFDAGRLEKVAALLESARPEDLYLHLQSRWQSPESVIRGAPLGSSRAPWPGPLPCRGAFHEWMRVTDLLLFLGEGVLTKVDRATMAVGLECRAPLLDHRVVELAWRLPRAATRRPKAVLLELLSRRLPRRLFERPKGGFGVPLDRWLRGPLAPWVERLLSEGRLVKSGFVDPAPLREMWQTHRAGRGRYHYTLWNAVVLAEWCEQSGAL